MGSDPVASDELQEQCPVNTTVAPVVDVFGYRLVAQLSEAQTPALIA